MHHRPTKGGTGWDCKAENAKAAGLYYEIANVGKMVEASKKRITWRIKVEEGKEYEISLTHSIASGKKILRIDGIVTHQTSAFSLADWDYVFNLGNHVLHCIIKPSVELNDSYDLIVDGISFRRLPEVLKPKPALDKDRRPSANRLTAPPKPQSRESSFSENRTGSGSWACTACTLINEKALAPVCEACGSPRPRHPAPVAKQPSFEYSKPKNVDAPVARAKTDLPPRAAPVINRRPSDFNPFDAAPPPTANDGFGVDMTTNDPFAQTNAAFNQQRTGSASSQRTGSSEQIASMLQGLDFSYTPPPAPPAPVQQTIDPTPAPPPTPSDPLWGSGIVSLDLNPQDKPKLKTATSMQTLEQARLAKPKEASQPAKPVMQPPPMQPAMGVMYQQPFQTTGFGGMQGGMQGGFMPPQQQHIMTAPMGAAPPPFANYNMGASGMLGQPSGFGGGQPMARAPQAPVQNFIPNMTHIPPAKATNPGPRPMGAMNDPFATLS